MSEEEDTNETKFTAQLNTIHDTLTLFKMQITNLQKVVRTIEKDFKKELKTIKKETNLKETLNSLN